MLKRIAYYFIVLPLSFLPLFILYLLTDFFYLLLITIVPYRRKVVRLNLKRAFPEKSDRERRQIENSFYRYFTDLLAESIKNLSISKLQLKRRLHVVNRDMIDQLYMKGKSVVFVGAHYNNWEWVISAQDFIFAHQAVGIGKPMTDSFWDERINARRSRFGMKIVHRLNFKQELNQLGNRLASILVLSDQSPGDSTKSYWTEFMGRPTAVTFGTELIAHQYDMAVVYLHMKKLKRGNYSIEFEMICEDPHSMEYGTITDKHVEILERIIRAEPSRWIWTHKRWKREMPENWKALKAEQKEKFNEKFGQN